MGAFGSSCDAKDSRTCKEIKDLTRETDTFVLHTVLMIIISIVMVVGISTLIEVLS